MLRHVCDWPADSSPGLEGLSWGRQHFGDPVANMLFFRILSWELLGPSSRLYRAPDAIIFLFTT